MTQDPAPTDRGRLEALRDRLQAVLEAPGTTPRDLATVSREYRLTIEKLAQLRPAGARSALDEITARRQQRGAS